MTLLTSFQNMKDRIMGGRGEHSITVPVMDGPLKPNDILDRAELIAHVEGAANIITYQNGLMLSSGSQLLTISAQGKTNLHSAYPAAITALAVSQSGVIAIGISGLGVTLLLPDGTTYQIKRAGRHALNCVTALAFFPDNSLAITNGSQQFEPDRWTHDLVHSGRSGMVAIAAPNAKQAEILAADLRYPSGLCVRQDDPDKLAISETWKHRIVEFSRSSKTKGKTLIDHLPSYPARIAPLSNGTYVLTNFSVRSQMIEFTLREKRYLRAMVREVPDQFWIAPSLSSGHSFKEPLQAGGVIRLGIHKPWAPSRSYGLLVGLDQEFQPIWSAHSRANGHRHGVTAAAETEHGLAVLAQGNGEILALQPGASPSRNKPAIIEESAS